ncbi:MAG TPA: DUF6172 family protein [Mariprofundaceae bacterium]|nr:DUF6172 family protein [Mariprofundaceae bacterium]
MKKVFQLTHPKIKPARLADSIRSEVKRYVQRERRKELPEGADFWDFDCRFGVSAEEATKVHELELPKCIAAAEAQGLESFYIEILARPGYRTEK